MPAGNEGGAFGGPPADCPPAPVNWPTRGGGPTGCGWPPTGPGPFIAAPAAGGGAGGPCPFICVAAAPGICCGTTPGRTICRPSPCPGGVSTGGGAPGGGMGRAPGIIGGGPGGVAIGGAPAPGGCAIGGAPGPGCCGPSRGAGPTGRGGIIVDMALPRRHARRLAELWRRSRGHGRPSHRWASRRWASRRRRRSPAVGREDGLRERHERLRRVARLRPALERLLDHGRQLLEPRRPSARSRSRKRRRRCTRESRPGPRCARTHGPRRARRPRGHARGCPWSTRRRQRGRALGQPGGRAHRPRRRPAREVGETPGHGAHGAAVMQTASVAWTSGAAPPEKVASTPPFE